MTKTAKHIKSFQPDANQDLWEDWAFIIFAFDIKRIPSIKIPFSDKKLPVCLHDDYNLDISLHQGLVG